VVHLFRAALRFVSYTDRKKMAAGLRRVYTAPTEQAARAELDELAGSELGKRHPAQHRGLGTGLAAVHPVPSLQPTLRKIIYTANAIESLNYQLRKIIKNRGHFPNDDAVIKLLWLAIRDFEDKRARARAKKKGVPRDQRSAPAKLVEGAIVQGWRAALGALALAYPDRIPAGAL